MLAIERGRRLAGGNVLVRKGADPSILVIAFNSHFQYLGMRSNEFELSSVTDAMGCSRIHCKDPQFVWYHAGLDSDHLDIRSSLQLLKELVTELAPTTLITTGASAGGYAALLSGHYLGANYVQVFGPNTCLARSQLEAVGATIRGPIWMRYERLWALPSAAADLYDLATVLAEHNGRTRYCVHYCAGSEKDRMSADHVRHLPGFEFFAHACRDHYIAVHMAMLGLLEPVLSPGTQPRLRELLAPVLSKG